MRTLPETLLSGGRRSITIKTSLYDLVDAVQQELGPENEALVVATIAHLLQSSRITWLHDMEDVSCN
jgi:hypothetical protein